MEDLPGHADEVCGVWKVFFIDSLATCLSLTHTNRPLPTSEKKPKQMLHFQIYTQDFSVGSFEFTVGSLQTADDNKRHCLDVLTSSQNWRWLNIW